MTTDHFDDLHFGVDAKMIQKHLQVLLHLNTVVFDFCPVHTYSALVVLIGEVILHPARLVPGWATTAVHNQPQRPGHLRGWA